MRHALPIVIILVLTACQTPVLLFPGKALSGKENATDSFAFAREYTLLTLEVSPKDPYSIFLRVSMIGDDLYIDAAPSRQWARRLSEDRRVRIRIGGKIYPAMATPVTDPDIVSAFRAGRTIYRLDPRRSAGDGPGQHDQNNGERTES